MRTETKRSLATARHLRIRKKVIGTSARPRMSVCMTGKHIYVQFVDDSLGRTLASVSTRAKTLRESKKPKANVVGAKQMGVLAAQAALAGGIAQVVFDRGGARYHGKVKALADAAREAGLNF